MEPSSSSSFRKLCRFGNIVPIWREIPADCLTPVLAFLLTADRHDRCFLLESVEGGERFGRYSFVGRDPYLVFSARGLDLEEVEGRRRTRRQGPFLERLRMIFERAHPVIPPGLPRFTGGAVGFIAYDAIRQFETLRPRAPSCGKLQEADPELPDALFGFYDTVLAFDHLHQTILVIASLRTEEDGRGLRQQFEAGMERLDRLASDLRRQSTRRRAAPPRPRKRGSRVEVARPNMTRRRYHRMVEMAKERIRAGDIYQVVLSQRFRLNLDCEPFAVYRALRRINPSPYMYFLRDGSTSLAGASPEMLVRVVDRQVELHPIAGTRPRGGDTAEDDALEAELKADPKERAEHVMLVDLGRNDLGRVCSAGDVNVPEFMGVERFSHVMHLVSRVTGTLDKGRDAFDALKAAFPAGTVSGAPKIRAMEIIDELEPVRRGAYGGVVCYIDYSGNLDSCLTIRTMVANGRQAHVQAGGGIVADSDPQREYEESRNKAKAVLMAMKRGGQWVS